MIQKRIRGAHNTKPSSHKPPHGKLRAITVGEDLPNLPEIMLEISGYWDILLGRVDPPVPNTVDALAETASAFYARGKEIEHLLHQGQRDGSIAPGSNHYKYRTGELRSFLEMSKNAFEMGSRRITMAKSDLHDPSF